MFENSCHVENCHSYYFCLPRMPLSILLLETDGAPGLEGWARGRAGPVGILWGWERRAALSWGCYVGLPRQLPDYLQKVSHWQKDKDNTHGNRKAGVWRAKVTQDSVEPWIHCHPILTGPLIQYIPFSAQACWSWVSWARLIP